MSTHCLPCPGLRYVVLCCMAFSEIYIVENTSSMSCVYYASSLPCIYIYIPSATPIGLLGGRALLRREIFVFHSPLNEQNTKHMCSGRVGISPTRGSPSPKLSWHCASRIKEGLTLHLPLPRVHYYGFLSYEL